MLSARIFSSERSRVYQIDFLRFIAAVSVMLHNITYIAPTNSFVDGVSFPLLESVTSYGYLGVELFFIISGFLIMYSAQDVSPTRFVASRMGRLYPAYWTAVTISALAIYLSGAGLVEVSWAQYLVNLSMIQTVFGTPHVDGVYWSLFYELRFYFLVFLVVWLAPGRFEEFLNLWLAICIAVSLAPTLNVMPVRLFFLPSYAPFFIAGALFYFGMHRGWTTNRLGALFLTYLLALNAARDEAARNLDNLAMATDPYIVGGFITVFFCLFFLLSVGRLSWPWAASFSVLAALTYPLYLSHLAVGEILMARLAPEIGAAPAMTIALVLPFVQAWLILRLVERPLSGRLRRSVQWLLEPIEQLWTRWRGGIPSA